MQWFRLSWSVTISSVAAKSIPALILLRPEDTEQSIDYHKKNKNWAKVLEKWVTRPGIEASFPTPANIQSAAYVEFINSQLESALDSSDDFSLFATLFQNDQKPLELEA